jgi:GAF domain-containing protein
VLGVINSSPGDLTPVFDSILEKAHALCEASLGSLVLYDGENCRAIATRGYPQEYAELARQGFAAADLPGLNALLRGETVHKLDPGAFRTFSPMARAVIEIARIRTLLAVPLCKEGSLLGYISAQREEARPFTDKQIALLQNFAAQAVIAMENARLLTETREALEQQTATAEILRVISSSPTDVQPTLDAIAAAATSLTDAKLSAVVTYDGELMHLRALSGFAISEAERVRALWPIPADHGTATGRAILTRQIVQIDDLFVDPGYSHPRLAQVSGRTVLAVPMLRDGIPIGAINVQRRDVQPFTDKQVDLFKTFADQAAIAIENVRLFNETKEALEQQTATAEVLQVVNSSPGVLAPVFDAILEKAHTLCGADNGALLTYDGELFWPAAWHGVSVRLIEGRAESIDPNVAESFGRIVRGASLEHTMWRHSPRNSQTLRRGSGSAPLLRSVKSAPSWS